MKVLISGMSGLVGSALSEVLKRKGYEVVALVRRPVQDKTREIFWNPRLGQLNPEDLAGIDAVIHLAGENIAEKPWTEKQKEHIRQSRVQGTSLLATAISQMETPPKSFISASAIGLYGDRGAEILSEASSPGNGFLPTVCREWESATAAAYQRGIRTACVRIGIVLSPEGGALAKMLPIFKLGGGGMLGNGKQYMSWIALDDVVGGIVHVLETSSLSGPVNLVSPNAVTNKVFTQQLGYTIFRPTIAPVPAFAVKLMFGEMGEALLLSSTRVAPKRLEESGYTFQYPDLASALKHVLYR